MKILKLVLTLLVCMMVVFSIISGCATKSEAVIEEPEPGPKEKDVVEEEKIDEEEVVEEKVEETGVDKEPDIKIIDKTEAIKKTTTYSYRVEFDVDSAVIRGNYYTNLQEAIDFMAAHPEAEIIKIIIEGHTDSSGSESYNYALADRRVNSVKQVLIGQLNIDPEIIETHSFGESKPIARNKTEAGRQKNRSTVVTILISY